MRRLWLYGTLGLAALWWVIPSTEVRATAPAQDRPLAVATFAGGCFWCMEPPFDEIDGVVETISGYTGGQRRNPTYEEVSAGRTGHAEAVQIRYDPAKVHAMEERHLGGDLA